MMITLAVGAMAAAMAAWLIVRKRAPRFCVWLALIAGLTVGAGVLGGMAHRIAAALAQAGSRGSAVLFGVVVPAIIGMLVICELVYVMRKKKGGKPHRIWHPVLAFLAPALLLAAGGIFATIAGWADQAVDVVPALMSSFTAR
jgi:hypothetical protein